MGNVLRLLVVGIGTVLGMTVLIAPFVNVLAASFGLPILHLALIGAGMTIAVGIVPSFLFWYVSAWLLAKTKLSSRRVPVMASAMTAVAGSAFITYGITRFASAGAFGVFTVLAVISAFIAALLTFLLFPHQTETASP